jgi:hypothetical protein
MPNLCKWDYMKRPNRRPNPTPRTCTVLAGAADDDGESRLTANTTHNLLLALLLVYHAITD